MGSFFSEWEMLPCVLKLMGEGELRRFFRSNVRLALVWVLSLMFRLLVSVMGVRFWSLARW